MWACGDDHVNIQMDELGSKSRKTVIVVTCEPRFDNKVPSDVVTELTHTLRKFVQVTRAMEVSDAPGVGAFLRWQPIRNACVLADPWSSFTLQAPKRMSADTPSMIVPPNGRAEPRCSRTRRSAEPAKGVGSSAALSGPSHFCLEGHPAVRSPEHTKLLQHASLVPLLPTLDHAPPRHVVED